MIETAALSGFVFLTLALMFGGRKRRSFAEASHAAAGFTIGVLCLAALLVFITGSISNFLGLAQKNYEPQTYLARTDER